MGETKMSKRKIAGIFGLSALALYFTVNEFVADLKGPLSHIQAKENIEQYQKTQSLPVIPR